MDHASVALLRAVMAEGWRAEDAARNILAAVREDRRLLRLLRARVSRALLDRPSRITERAALTLDLALAQAPAHVQPSVPPQGGVLV